MSELDPMEPDPMEPASETTFELELPLPSVKVTRVVIRRFRYRMRPLPVTAGPLEPATGVELELLDPDSDLTVSVRFDRSEFVNIATGGIRMLDAADDAATNDTEGR